MTTYRYVVLGAGRQGTAAAYDLIIRGEAMSVLLADVSEEQAVAAANRVNRLAATDRATGVALDANDSIALRQVLQPFDVVISALPYELNFWVAEAAVDTRTHECDLGGNMSIVRAQLELDERAKSAGICVIPDCGEAPGMANNLIAYVMGLLDEPEEAILYDGGIPQDPLPPWNYACTFHIDGLTNEYDGTTTYVVEGRPVEVACLDPTHDELVDLGEPLGVLEAFVAATGSTTAFTLGRRLRTLRFKVLRYPGHAAQFRAFRDLGLFSKTPIDVGDSHVVPRDVFHALLEPRIGGMRNTRDLVIAHVEVTGLRGGRPARAIAQILVDPNEELGFTAMEQATGWHAAIVAHLMAAGRIRPGATPVEVAVNPQTIVDAIRARGFRFREEVTPLQPGSAS